MSDDVRTLLSAVILGVIIGGIAGQLVKLGYPAKASAGAGMSVSRGALRP